MDTSDWISLAAVVIATGTGAPSLYFTRVSARASEASAEAARRSVQEAKALTAIEGERRVEERERVHHDLGPIPPGAFVAELFNGTAADSLISTITVPRGYRIRAEAIYYSGGSTGAGLGNMLHPNRKEKFHFEQWPPGSKQPVTKEIWIRFWPPLDPDGMDVWACPCGRPTGESLDGPGHWEWRVPVVYDEQRPQVRWA